MSRIKYAMQCEGDEIYFDHDTQELVMIGIKGEDRINLSLRLKQAADYEERATIIMANFLYCVQQYCGLQLGDPVLGVFKPDQPVDTSNAIVPSNKKDEMN